MQLVDVEDIQGRTVKTNMSFLSYKSVFEKMTPILSSNYGVNLYNSSQDSNGGPAGIVQAGLEPMPLDDWINRFVTKKCDEIEKIQEVYKSYAN